MPGMWHLSTFQLWPSLASHSNGLRALLATTQRGVLPFLTKSIRKLSGARVLQMLDQPRTATRRVHRSGFRYIEHETVRFAELRTRPAVAQSHRVLLHYLGTSSPQLRLLQRPHQFFDVSRLRPVLLAVERPGRTFP